MNEELEKIAQDMRRKERELWAGNPPRMGNGAAALMLDGYASRLEVALGLAPRPKGKAAEREREMAKGLSKKLDGNRAITGNGAAIYTALDSVRIEMLKRLAGIQPQISDMGILELCVDAQHKPVRNCDRDDCAWDAQVEFRRSFRDAYGNPAPSGDDPAYWGLFVNWLFAPAEGGPR